MTAPMRYLKCEMFARMHTEVMVCPVDIANGPGRHSGARGTQPGPFKRLTWEVRDVVLVHSLLCTLFSSYFELRTPPRQRSPLLSWKE